MNLTTHHACPVDGTPCWRERECPHVGDDGVRACVDKHEDCDTCAHHIPPDDGGEDVGFCLKHCICFEVDSGLCRYASNDQPSKCGDWAAMAKE